ncbi:hypothetical protein ACIP5Y_47550 [Nocardia sp. NPDC088792]|uniref:hypothetical protein n=1 Tax=Nocardia sp. NPDC088792 TaxID=3364332 RepID=UPI00381568C2
MAVGRVSRIAAVVTAGTALGAGISALAPAGNAAGLCGADLGDYRGEFAAQEESGNVLQFDGAGGITFRSAQHGNGSGIYAVIPSGGFTASLRMDAKGPGAPANATGMVKTTTFYCAAPGTIVTSFTSLDQSSGRFTYNRVN